ncbi:hypothetical protein Hanom_Chr01g00041521 [Helianthus anomalus]
MELRSQMKMARFQTFWIQMQKNKPLDESRKTGQTSGTKTAFYSFSYLDDFPDCSLITPPAFARTYKMPSFITSLSSSRRWTKSFSVLPSNKGLKDARI